VTIDPTSQRLVGNRVRLVSCDSTVRSDYLSSSDSLNNERASIFTPYEDFGNSNAARILHSFDEITSMSESCYASCEKFLGQARSSSSVILAQSKNRTSSAI
jgi:hypothetical protein